MKDWRRYEVVAREILERLRQYFGLIQVEKKQLIAGASGTEWEIDAIGIAQGGGKVLIECRLTKSPQTQADLGAFAFTIIDTGSESGIMVTTQLLQEGASKVANAQGIVSVRLNPRSTPENFALEMLDRLFLGVPSIDVAGSVGRPSIGRG